MTWVDTAQYAAFQCMQQKKGLRMCLRRVFTLIQVAQMAPGSHQAEFKSTPSTACNDFAGVSAASSATLSGLQQHISIRSLLAGASTARALGKPARSCHAPAATSPKGRSRDCHMLQGCAVLCCGVQSAEHRGSRCHCSHAGWHRCNGAANSVSFVPLNISWNFVTLQGGLKWRSAAPQGSSGIP